MKNIKILLTAKNECATLRLRYPYKIFLLQNFDLIPNFSCDSGRWRWRCHALFSWNGGEGSHGSAYLQSKYLSLPRRMDRPKLWYNFIRQHRFSDVDSVSMCQYGRMDTDSVCSKYQSNMNYIN